MLIAQLSDIHVGGGRYREELLRTAIAEINAAEPDLVVLAGDLTDDGYPDQYPLAADELAALAAPQIVRVPGNHDARNVGYVLYEDTFGPRDSRLRFECGGLDVALIGVDSSKPDIDEGEIGREHYGWIEEGFADESDLRVFVCHHHLMPVPGTGRERNQVLDAGDVLALLRRCGVDLVLSGHRHVPYVWPLAGMLLVHRSEHAAFPSRPTTSSESKADASRSSFACPVATAGASATIPATGPRSSPRERSTHSCARRGASRWQTTSRPLPRGGDARGCRRRSHSRRARRG
jgi:3',5'-cyclic-AMP phosphodiesterase